MGKSETSISTNTNDVKSTDSKEKSKSVKKNGDYFDTPITQMYRKYHDEKENKHLSHEDISKETGIPLWKVKKIYSGTATLDFKTELKQAYKFAKILGHTIFDLMGITPEDDITLLTRMGLPEENANMLKKHNVLNLFGEYSPDGYIETINYLISKEELIIFIDKTVKEILLQFEDFKFLRNNEKDEYRKMNYNELYQMLDEKNRKIISGNENELLKKITDTLHQYIINDIFKE